MAVMIDAILYFLIVTLIWCNIVMYKYINDENIKIMSKIYIVQAEWLDRYKSHDRATLGAFYTRQEAVQCMQKERDTLLEESYHVSLEEAKNSEYIDYNENDVGCLIAQTYDFAWDKISIIETTLPERKYIDVLFKLNSKMYCERIYLDQIDMTHYDTLWDWWFTAKKNGPDVPESEPIFEITAEKDENGEITTNNMYINVYANSDVDDWSCQIKGVKVRKSWADNIMFEEIKTK